MRGFRDAKAMMPWLWRIPFAPLASPKRETDGIDVLASMFSETASPAMWLLSKQGMSLEKVASFTPDH